MMNLLMLTKLYPYGTGEAFIENEINIIAKYFEKIVVIACEVPEKEEKKRQLPENIVAYKISAKSKNIDVIKGCIQILHKNYDYKNEKKECKNFIQKIFLNYFEEKSQRIYAEIENKDFLREIKNNTFAIYSYWLFTTARVGTLISAKENINYMYTRAHRYDLYSDKNKIGYLPYRKLFLEKYNKVFPCSNNGTRYLKNMYPKFAGNIQTSLLGTIDHGIGIKSNDGIFRVVSCSRVEPVKRVEKLAESLSLLEEDEIELEWTHIGGGSGLVDLKKYVSKNLKKIKINLLGDMKNTEVLELYRSHPFDLFVNVSSSEGLPVSIMEALSFGLPCVATDVGGTSEIVIEDVTGKLISSDFKAQELADIIKKFVNGDIKKISRENCRQYWENNFQAINNYTKLYQMLNKEMNIGEEI